MAVTYPRDVRIVNTLAPKALNRLSRRPGDPLGPLPQPRRALIHVVSWFMWSGYWRFRQHPVRYLAGVGERSVARFATRHYPEVGDWDDCEACGLTPDGLCVGHQGQETMAAYVTRQLPKVICELWEQSEADCATGTPPTAQQVLDGLYPES